MFLIHTLLIVVHGGVGIWLVSQPTHYYYHGFEVGQMSWWFLFMAALDHLCSGGVLLLTREPCIQTDRLLAAIRWTEYLFSATTMNTQIAMLSQVDEIPLVVFTALCTMLMITEGAVADLFEVSETHRKMYEYHSWIAFIVAWTPIFVYFFDHAARIPAFVIAIIFILFSLESLFGAVFHFFREPTQREFAYATLSLTAKLSLALITFNGAKARPN
jgi:hypothetical protein